MEQDPIDRQDGRSFEDHEQDPDWIPVDVDDADSMPHEGVEAWELGDRADFEAVLWIGFGIAVITLVVGLLDQRFEWMHW